MEKAVVRQLMCLGNRLQHVPPQEACGEGLIVCPWVRATMDKRAWGVGMAMESSE
jgi:hypothetical protein